MGLKRSRFVTGGQRTDLILSNELIILLKSVLSESRLACTQSQQVTRGSLSSPWENYTNSYGHDDIRSGVFHLERL